MKALRALFVVAAVALAGAAGQVLPDEQEPTAAQAVGYAIISALAPTDEPADRAYEWGNVGPRLGGPIYWHLAPPERSREHYTHRTGWVPGRYETGGAAACGDRNVRLLTFRLDGEESVVRRDILKSFDESGVVLTPHGRDQQVNLQNFAPGLLRTSETCTRPGSAMMRHCWTEVRFALRADDEGALSFECRAP